jgi:hypothetical protein
MIALNVSLYLREYIVSHNLYLLYLAQFLALSWNFPLPGNFHSRITDSIEKQETENEAEIVFPSVPPAFMDTKESDRGTAVEPKQPVSRPKMKRRGISRSMPRNIKKKNARIPPLCTYLAYISASEECQDAIIMYVSHLSHSGEYQDAIIMYVSRLSHCQWRMPGCHHHVRISLISQWRMPGCHHHVRILLISQSVENARMPSSCMYL